MAKKLRSPHMHKLNGTGHVQIFSIPAAFDFGHRASNTTLQPAASGQHVMTASIFKYLGPQSEIAYICRRNGVSVVQAGVHT